jgi:putative inorganic carbon (hco3(-)) transporter
MDSWDLRGPLALSYLALILLGGAGAGLLLWSNPLVLLLAGGIAFAAAIGLFLLLRPLTALYVALFIRLIPWENSSDEVVFAFTVAQNIAFAVAFCAWMLHASSQRRPIQWNGVCFLIALYIFWAGVTLLWAHDVVAGLEKLRRYSAGLIFVFLVVNLVKSPRAIDGMMRVLAVVGWYLVILGLQVALFTDYHPERLKILNMNENQSGALLILMLPGVIWPVVRSSGLRRSLHLTLSIVYMLCTVILVLLSGSRGSTLALASMLVALCFWKPLRPWGIVGGALVACLLISAPFLLGEVGKRFMEDTQTQLGGRDILWEASFYFIEDHPFTGAGVGNGPVELVPYVAALTNHYDYVDHPLPSHNPLLEAGVDTGIFGIVVYFSICVAALRQFFWCSGRWYLHGGALTAYFPIVLISAAGYITAFLKDGADSHPTFFLLLALLIIPSQLSRDFRLANLPARRVVAPPDWCCQRGTQVARTNQELM